MGKSLEKLRMFLTAEAKRSADNGIKPIERVPLKNRAASPTVALRSALSLLPKEKERGEHRKLGATSFQGVCPKCGASGPKRESHREALRAWNRRE